jgi:saccharopine dehydrogenase-like NADP-dependent oxidoreductase
MVLFRSVSLPGLCLLRKAHLATDLSCAGRTAALWPYRRSYSPRRFREVRLGPCARRILTNAKPPVDEDVVYVHVAAEGWVGGALRRKEFVRAYYPLEIAGKSRTAIAWTTSASVVAVIEMVRDGKLPQQGFLKHEDIPLAPYLATTTGNFYQVGHRSRHGG